MKNGRRCLVLGREQTPEDKSAASGICDELLNGPDAATHPSKIEPHLALNRPQRSVVSKVVLRTLRAAAVSAVLALLSLLVLRPEVDRLIVVSSSGQVWLKVGDGKVTCLTSNEPGPASVRWRFGPSAYEANDPNYFSPKKVHVTLPGFECVVGTWYTTTFTGIGLSLSYWYPILAGALLALACQWCLQRERVRSQG
jgi:hypothetical protein